MKLVLIMSGVKFNIYAIDLSNDPDVKDCPAKEFIQNMSKASLNSLTAILQNHKDHGPIKNIQKSRLLWDDIYEFKTRQGDRLFFFYYSDRKSILTHGSIKPKKKQLLIEVAKAVDIKNIYFEGN